jgi:parallel beta-helix repeat protein
MKNARRNKKALRIAVVLVAAFLTATIFAVATANQNQNQNMYPLISLCLQGVPPSPDAVIQPKIDIGESTILNGSTYYETIVVTADNIVIDGNGSIVQGTGPGYGFNLTGRSNVTIFNVTVTGWASGFFLESSSNNNLSGNNATSNDYGFYLHSSNNNNLTGNIATGNTYDGFYLDDSDNNNLTGNTATSNNYGFFLSSSSSYNNLTGNNALGNDYGFVLFSSSCNNTLYSDLAVNSTTQAYYYSTDSIGNNFTDSVEANYLRIRVLGAFGGALQGADVMVEVDGNIIYASPGFNGTDSPTDGSGLTAWIIVPFKTCVDGTTWLTNTTNVTVKYSGLTFTNNPRTVNMSSSHIETFQSEQGLQTLMIALAGFLLAGAQGGVSPMVYVVGVIAGVGVVAAVLLYYFRFRR